MFISRDSRRLVYNIACSENEIKALVKIMKFLESLFLEDTAVKRFITDFIEEVQLLLGPNSGKGE